MTGELTNTPHDHILFSFYFRSLVEPGSHPLGYLLSSLSIIWCTYSASGIFTTILRMDHQRFLVAYPVGLLYGVFALLSVFGVKK
jgi:hypothetical protein